MQRTMRPKTLNEILRPPFLPLLILALLTLLAGAHGPAVAQDADQADTAASPPSLFGEVIDVRVINVEVVVTDKDGNPVMGLGPDDFRLRVDGDEQPIDYFTEIRGGVAIEPMTAEEGEEAAPEGPGSLPSLAPGEPVPTSYLLFIDDYFAISQDRNRVLDSMLEQLPLLGPEDRMAVVAFDGRQIEMLSTWSGSTTELRRTLQDAKFRQSYGLNRFGEERFFETASQLDDFGRGPFDLSFEEREYARELARQVRRSVLAASSTLRGFADPPGRKVMLLLSGGWPFSPGQYAANDPGRPVLDPSVPTAEELYDPLVQTANLLGYTLYPVDVPGLDANSRADVSLRAGTGVAPGALSFRETLDEETLYYVAAETGGEALVDGASTAAFEQAVQDTRTYYWLGFDSERDPSDKPHRIEVDVVDNDYRVRSRDSYQELSRDKEISLAVESALLFGSPPGFDNLPVGAGEAQRDGRRFMVVPIRVAIPIREITLVPQGEEWVAQLELRIAAVDESGDQSDIPVVPLNFRLEEEPDPNQYLPYQTNLRLRNEEQRVIVALYDVLGNSLKSNTLDIEPVEKE